MKQNFFNKAIFKANLKRFWTGSVLYLVLLLLLSCFWDVYPGMEDFQSDFFPYRDYFIDQFFMTNILSMFVAVVVSSLLFRFVHSKKQSVFLHSSPVSRLAAYITSLLSAVTLMAVPVIITGFVISVATDKFLWGMMWIGYTLFALFSYFAVACFCAMLTGASYITFVLYFALVNGIGFVQSFVNSIMQLFAAGYRGSGDWVVFKILNIRENLSNIIYPGINGFSWSGTESTIILLIHWATLFLLSYLLYKKRSMEKCEDAAAYKWFYYVLKYIAVSVSVMLVFLAYEELSIQWLVWSLVISCIVYFGVEMVLRKEIKVWGAYKGYVAFLICYGLFLLFMAKSTIFGYETYQPKINKIDTMTVMTNFGSGGSFTDYECIEKMYNHHARVIESTRKGALHEEQLVVGYETDGKWVYREYFIPKKMRDEIMNSMYESETFKIQTNEVFDISDKKVISFTISEYRGGKIADHVKKRGEELLECVKNDILSGNFTDLHGQKGYVIDFYCYESYEKTQYYSVTINSNWTQTISWLKENGYGYSWKK